MRARPGAAAVVLLGVIACAGARAPARAGSGQAGGGAPGDDRATAGVASSPHEVRGKLVGIHAASGEVEIERTDAPSFFLKVDSRTTIRVNGQEATLTDLRPGGDVRASFTPTAGEWPSATVLDESAP